ncbi:hypothetical protein B0T19DRAFT_53742 [Cercophora scortea]|uniref:SWI5-dependent HO expression protein 3 n=1 Tax=Cercophora scortea TaxID=314031 RepID=A0AAE0J5H5_9PEZI|nr:hypothetical protein B0T19DRAFT_53742 [Cercophora scortea]
MRNRLSKIRPHSNHKPGFHIHQDDESKDTAVTTPPKEAAQADRVPSVKSTPTKAPRPDDSHEGLSPRSTLALASSGIVNAVMSRTTTTNGANGKGRPLTPARMNSTIRPVVSFDDRHRSSEDSSTDWTPSQTTSRNSALSSSLNSNTSMSSVSQQQAQTPNGASKPLTGPRLKQSMPALHDGLSPTLEVPRTLATSRSSVEIPLRESSLSATAMPANTTSEPPPDGGGAVSNDVSLSATEAHLSNANGWDSTVGKAGLGKTGRVINKLVSDNEALKRDIKIERLRAEESKQTARLLEDKLERIVSEYESRLLETNVTKALLARKERQVESLQSMVELERKRAVDAGTRERTWKDEMETTRADAKRRVEEATNYAALMEGRYNAISSHWRDQGEEVKKSMGKMETEVANLVLERKSDDDRISTLRDLCDQQDGNIRELKQQKEEIAEQFAKYRAEQEQALKDIKTKAMERELEQERIIRESKEVLDKLRWALNVKDKLEWAQ